MVNKKAVVDTKFGTNFMFYKEVSHTRSVCEFRFLESSKTFRL